MITDVISCYYSDLGTNICSLIIEKGNETLGMVDIISGSVILCSGLAVAAIVVGCVCVCAHMYKDVHLRFSESFPQFSLLGPVIVIRE